MKIQSDSAGAPKRSPQKAGSVMNPAAPAANLPFTTRRNFYETRRSKYVPGWREK